MNTDESPSGESDPWTEAIIRAFRESVDRGVDGGEIVTISLDEEHLRYFDRVVVELTVADARLPHHRAPDHTFIRSAIVAVVIGGLVGFEGDWPLPAFDGTAAWAGGLASHLRVALRQRMASTGRARLREVEIVLTPTFVERLNPKLEELARTRMPHDLVDFYFWDDVNEFRAAFIEAGLLTWMIWRGLVGEDAVSRRLFSPLDLHERDARRRRPLRQA